MLPSRAAPPSGRQCFRWQLADSLGGHTARSFAVGHVTVPLNVCMCKAAGMRQHVKHCSQWCSAWLSETASIWLALVAASALPCCNGCHHEGEALHKQHQCPSQQLACSPVSTATGYMLARRSTSHLLMDCTMLSAGRTVPRQQGWPEQRPGCAAERSGGRHLCRTPSPACSPHSAGQAGSCTIGRAGRADRAAPGRLLWCRAPVRVAPPEVLTWQTLQGSPIPIPDCLQAFVGVYQALQGTGGPGGRQLAPPRKR